MIGWQTSDDRLRKGVGLTLESTSHRQAGGKERAEGVKVGDGNVHGFCCVLEREQKDLIVICVMIM